MSHVADSPATRVFEPFFDEIDGTLCLPADASAADVRALVGSHAWRFPLLLDESATLHQHLAASTHAPASSRFGPYGDNVLGMNWRLPDGHLLRVGERVVKTTTGYDWFRFLLHAPADCGQPEHYVIRLRPDCGVTGQFLLGGAPETVRQAAPRLLRDCWLHWFDAVDVIEQGGASSLRITVHCSDSEWTIFEDHLRDFAGSCDLDMNVQRDIAPPADGLPDAVFKTTPREVLFLAVELARAEAGARAVALLHSGVVHLYLQPAVDDVTACVNRLTAPPLVRLHALGGDARSRHLPPTPPAGAEANWIQSLSTALHVH